MTLSKFQPGIIILNLEDEDISNGYPTFGQLESSGWNKDLLELIHSPYSGVPLQPSISSTSIAPGILNLSTNLIPLIPLPKGILDRD